MLICILRVSIAANVQIVSRRRWLAYGSGVVVAGPVLSILTSIELYGPGRCVCTVKCGLEQLHLMVVVIQHRSMPSLCLSWMRTEGLTWVGGTHTLGADKDVSDGGNRFVESEIARGDGEISECECSAVQSLSIESQAFGDDMVLSEGVRWVEEFQIFSADAVWSDSGRSCWQTLGVVIDEPEIDTSQTSSPRIDSDWILPVIGDPCASDAASVSRFSNRSRSFSPRKSTLSVSFSFLYLPRLIYIWRTQAALTVSTLRSDVLLPSFFRVATDRFSLLFSHALAPCFLLRRVSWHRVYRFAVWIFRADGRMDEVGWVGRLMGKCGVKSTRLQRHGCGRPRMPV